MSPAWCLGQSLRSSLSRSTILPSGPRYRHVIVDLLDAEDTARKLADLTDVTHIFYAAFQATSGSASNFALNTDPNHKMLVNSVPTPPELGAHSISAR
jgi:hypothetical protein